MQIEISKDEVLRCKRAVLALNDLAKLSLELSKTKMPLEMKTDIHTLVAVIKRLDPKAA